MDVSAFLSSDTAVGLSINCFVSSLWHHVRGTYRYRYGTSFCLYRHKQILSDGWICFVGESNCTHRLNVNVLAFLLLFLKGYIL